MADKQFSALVNLLKAIERVCCWFWKGSSLVKQFWKGRVWWNKDWGCELVVQMSLVHLLEAASQTVEPASIGMHFQRLMVDPTRTQLFCCRIKHLSSTRLDCLSSSWDQTCLNEDPPMIWESIKVGRSTYTSLTTKRKLWEICVYVGLLVYPRKQTKQIIKRQILKFLAILWLLLLVEKSYLEEEVRWAQRSERDRK